MADSGRCQGERSPRSSRMPRHETKEVVAFPFSKTFWWLMQRRSASALEEEIAKLKSELSFARHAVLLIIRDELARILVRYHDCKTRQDVRPWLKKAIDEVMECSERRPAAEMGDTGSASDRSYCPLCGGSADNIYDIKGFAYPEGLSRHLHGSFNARQCVVMKVVTELALDHVSDGGPN